MRRKGRGGERIEGRKGKRRGGEERGERREYRREGESREKRAGQSCVFSLKVVSAGPIPQTELVFNVRLCL